MTKKEASPYRNLVCGVNRKVPLPGGQLQTYINFDNAASTPPFTTVKNKIEEIAPWYASVHRGQGYKSKLTTSLYEKTRKTIASFVGATPGKQSIILTANTTAAINKLSYRLQNIEKDKKIIITSGMEHHSNLLPWQEKYQLLYAPLTPEGRISLAGLEQLLRANAGQVKLLTITGASNVTGYITPVHRAARLAHKYGAKIHIDGAQLIPHQKFNMKPPSSPEHIDYVSFSAHKLYAPFGSGVLIGPSSTFNRGRPEYTGGGTVKLVTDKNVIWKQAPHREEAGSPNIFGAIALKQALKTLTEINLEKVHRYEYHLSRHLLQKLIKLPRIILYTPKQINRQLSLIPFNIKGLHHSQVAKKLADRGIGVRSGCFCAQPYVQKLLGVPDKQVQKRLKNPAAPHPGMVRISLGLYNTRQEINLLSEILREIIPS